MSGPRRVATGDVVEVSGLAGTVVETDGGLVTVRIVCDPAMIGRDPHETDPVPLFPLGRVAR